MHRSHGRACRILATGLAASALVAASAATAVAATARIRVGSTTSLPRDARVQGTVPLSAELQMTLALEPRDPLALQTFATDVSTPGTPLYGQYLTAPQFAQRFGAAPAQVAAVQAALRAQGLYVGTPTANRLTIPIAGTAAQVERAFSVSLARVTLPSGRIAYANRRAPALPTSVAAYVQGVVGLNNVTPDQPAVLRTLSADERLGQASGGLQPHVTTNGGPQPCADAQAQAQGTASAPGLTADEVATAYQFVGLYGAGDLGAGQTIAMVEEQPYNPTDIATYQACYGTSTAVTNVDIDGGPGPYQPPPAGAGDGESTLDIEQAIGLAPQASILVYEAPDAGTTPSSPVDILSAIVSQDKAKVISTSYGLCEDLTDGTMIKSENTLLQEAAAQGQSFFASSGDSGSTMCFQADPTNMNLSVEDPAAQPFATGVGGTTLYAINAGQAAYYGPGETPVEGVWNDGIGSDGRASATGGGLSDQWTMPSYQSGAPASVGVVTSNSSGIPCAGAAFCREVPDVAADGDPNTGYVVYSDGSWQVVGGTSASTPLWAAFTALANASAACRGLSLGFANPALYEIAGSSYSTNFTDTKNPSPFLPNPANNDPFEGSNPNDPNQLFPVTGGYDMTTGLGSMIGSTLAGTLCGLRAPVYTIAVTNPGTQQTVVSNPVAVQMTATDSGNAALTYTASGLPAGLAIGASTGIISGIPTAPGISTVTVKASDAYTNTGSTQFQWVIAAPPAVSNGSLKGLSRRKPTLMFTVGAGANGPTLDKIVISLPHGLTFSKSSRSLSKGIVVKAGGVKRAFKLSVSRGVLTLTFDQQSAQVTIGYPAIIVAPGLAARAERHKIKTLTLSVKALDASGASTPLTVHLKV